MVATQKQQLLKQIFIIAGRLSYSKGMVPILSLFILMKVSDTTKSSIRHLVHIPFNLFLSTINRIHLKKYI